MADGSVFARLSAQQQKKLIERVKEQGRRARHDPGLFIETCARTEIGQQAVNLVAHQRLLLRFVMQFPMCVVRMPVGSSKTFLMTFLGMWFLGRDNTSRGVIVSSEAGQAKQPLSLIRQYIENESLGLVFPELQRSPDPHDPWRDDRLVIARPAGIRTPSMRAIGWKGKLHGNRINWALVDDLLNEENTATAEQRDKVSSSLESNVLTRLDPAGARCVVTNTPWHRNDVTFRLEQRKWKSISFSVEGDVWFANLTDDEINAYFGALVRPSRIKPGRWRLRAHDPDPNEVKSLWLAQFPPERIEQIRTQEQTPFNYARYFLCSPFDEGASRCLQEWVDWSFENGAGQVWPAKRTGTRPTYTGVDIGGVDKTHDLSSICTIELLEGNKRRILNLQSGRWHGPELVSRIAQDVVSYDSTVYVESNGAQKFIADFALLADRNMRVVKFDTGRNKYDETFGVEAVFTEMMRKQWIWPDGAGLGRATELTELGKECVFYNPADHTGDRLMSLFLARQGIARHRAIASSGGVGTQRSAIRGGGF